MRARNYIAECCLLCIALSLSSVAFSAEKKLISVGWDMPNAERLLENSEVMDATPFRGTSLRFTGRNNTPFLDFAHNREIWKPEDIAQITEDLAAVKLERLTDCFLDIKATPGDVDWFDDEGWTIIVDHWRTAARVAKEGGIAGLLFDPESYDNAQFGYEAQAEAEQHTFEEYEAMARRRGAEVMTAVCEEYPDITVFTLFMLSIFNQQAGHPSLSLATSRYGLYPAFVDGWLDTISREATLVDGCESAYRFNSNEAHLVAANLIRNTCQQLVSPENRYTYRAQVQVSFGIYLDAYTNPPESPWYIDPGDQTAVQRFEENLLSAINAADEYVWLYGEKGSWWPTPHSTAGARRWPEALPGIEDVLWSVTDPIAHAASKVAGAREEADNAAINGDFSAETAAPAGVQADDWEQEGAPAGWSFWQSPAAGSVGDPGWDREVGRSAAGAATMRNVRKGCLIHSIEVQPGERYAIEAWFKQKGEEGVPSGSVRWQTADGTWHVQHLDSFLMPHEADGAWQSLVGLARVPEGAGRLVLLLNSDGQRSDDDVIWWDDVAVFKIH